MCKLQAAEVHMHYKHVEADYDASPSCRFSHATAQLC